MDVDVKRIRELAKSRTQGGVTYLSHELLVDLLDRLEAAERERSLLGEAIRDAAVGAGILRADASVSGPMLLMLCQDLVAAAKRQAVAITEFPSGAVANGLELLRRLSDHYQFECDGGTIEGCVEYQRLEQCLRSLAEYEAQSATTSPGIAAIAAERRRQIEKEGWSPEHDDAYLEGELSAAASEYATAAFDAINGFEIEEIPMGWPDGWDLAWWKPSTDPRRNLEKAGALIAAELDRLNRAEGRS